MYVLKKRLKTTRLDIALAHFGEERTDVSPYKRRRFTFCQMCENAAMCREVEGRIVDLGPGETIFVDARDCWVCQNCLDRVGIAS